MRELLSLLPKPSRYLGNEPGAVRPDAGAGKPAARLHVGLCFPDMYEVGMSYLGQKILYGIVNDHPGWLAERVFAPCREAGAVLRAHSAPLCTLESDTPLRRLDALGLSITHELCYTNVLHILDLGGIPLRAADRRGRQADGRAWPLIVAGGGCTLSAEPLAPFMDVMVLGEGEEALPELLRALEQARREQADRKEILRHLSRISGVYVPELYAEQPDGTLLPRPGAPEHITRRVVRDLNDVPYPVRQPIAFGAVHNRLALEIARGCTRGCRFCQAGSLYRPARERAVPRLRQTLESCLNATGFDDVSFLSLSTGDFSALKSLFMDTVDRCAQEQISVSLPSLRVGSIDDAIMERMAGIRRTGATLAPEAGSARLRAVINKGVTEEDLILHVQKLFEHGWDQVKLYFMIGLPTETDEDLRAIVDLCRKARDAAGPGIKRMQITAAISPFVPKPHTPFQWEAQISLEEIRRRIGLLLEMLKKEKRIRMRWHEPDMSLLEGVFSRGDRRLADVVESAWRKDALFAGWVEGFSLAPWLEAMEEHGLRVEDYTRARRLDEPLPWDHLRSGLDRDFFLRERERALAEKSTSDCRYTVCHACGVCDTKNRPSLLDPPPAAGASSPDASSPDASGITKTDGPLYQNILNNPARDQEAHTVRLDEHGRVIVRARSAGAGAAGTGTAGTGTAGGSGENRAAPPEKPGAKKRPPELPAHLTAKAMHLRVEYARTGPAAWLSQLEAQHIFERALRRAGAPLTFSQGFHPLPLLSFGRALPVGVASMNEWFALFLREPRKPEELRRRLNDGLPAGLSVTAVAILPPGAKPRDAERESYLLEALPLFATATEDRASEARRLAEALGRIAALSSLPVTRETKKGPRSLDARPYFADIHRADTSPCMIVMDWSAGYVSPQALCLQALAAVGLPLLPPQIRLTKIAASSPV